MSRARIAALVAALALGAATPAFADLTAFAGANTTPDTRLVKGAAIGMSFVLVGVEVEYAVNREDAVKSLPGLKTGMFNGFIQTPLPIAGFQPYVTIGGGLYQETLGAHEDKGVGMNVGAGLKVTLIGPLRLRGDYRVLKLGSGALTSPVHRIYVGLNLKF